MCVWVSQRKIRCVAILRLGSPPDHLVSRFRVRNKEKLTFTCYMSPKSFKCHLNTLLYWGGTMYGVSLATTVVPHMLSFVIAGGNFGPPARILPV